jgi:hypothetical protein
MKKNYVNISICLNAEPILEITQPINFEKFAVIPPATTADIDFKFQIIDFDIFKPRMCMTLVSTTSGDVLLAPTCSNLASSTGEFTLPKVPVGKYNLSNNI